MTDADKIVKGLQEATLFAAGEEPPERIRLHGYDYVLLSRAEKAEARVARLERELETARGCLDGARATVKALQNDLYAESSVVRALESSIRRLQDSNSKMAEEWSAAIKRAVEQERERILRVIERMDEGGHCGEDTSEKISRQRRNHAREEIAVAIRKQKT